MSPRDPRTRRRLAASLLTALTLGLLLTLLIRLSVREDYWLDEGYTVRRVAAAWRQLLLPFSFRPPEPVHPFDSRDVFDLNPPFYFALIRLLAGPAPGPLVMRLFSSLPLLLGLLALADWARRTLGARAQLALAVIGATTPTLIYYGHEARPYALPFALACLLIWLAPRLWRRPGALAAASLLATVAGCLSHFAFAWWTVALWLLYAMAFLQARREGNPTDRRAAVAVMAGLAGGAFLAVLAVVPQFAILAECQHASSEILGPEALMCTVGFPFSRAGIFPTPPLVCLLLQGMVLAVLLVLLRDSPRHQQGTIALALWLFPLALPLIVKYWFHTAFFARYTFFALAGWLMMLAWIAQETAERRGWRRALILSLFLALLTNNILWGALNLHRPLRQEWRPVIQALTREIDRDDYYSVDPFSMRVIFAVNAKTRPLGTYVDIRQGPPPQARTYWIVSDSIWNRDGLGGYDPPDWKKQLRVHAEGLELYRLDRLRPAPSASEPPGTTENQPLLLQP